MLVFGKNKINWIINYLFVAIPFQESRFGLSTKELKFTKDCPNAISSAV
jgi:hypothetical protein